MNPLFLFAAYDKEAKTIIKNKTEIPEKREVVLSVFNSASQAVFAKVSLPNSPLKQKTVRKINSHKKKNFHFVTIQNTKLEDFKMKIVDLDLTEGLLKRKREEVSEKGKEKVSEPQAKKACIDLTTSRDSDYENQIEATPSSPTTPSFLETEGAELPRIFFKLVDIAAKNSISERDTLDPNHEVMIVIKNIGEKELKCSCRVSRGDGKAIPFIKGREQVLNEIAIKIVKAGEVAPIGSFSPASSTDGRVIIEYFVSNIPVKLDQVFRKQIELNVKKD
ncbi:hypothetical protein [Criblamydia sequanensis]|uniref:Uncharacterized protein n=1 Tax=Candidatus Criblamydia sequanensis CRIB-18 TaxID=1437425 RepID=A0A090D338_9BACT|nr:hypothetical protein [Criblamydia sequanensis]CDR34903.1 hypothetical protein CSEC_2097 [Criblamydia sequanensis CRIB-18]